MIRMILADDEPIITRGIQKLVDWNSLGIEVVGEYADGKAALEGILSLKPDIALLDIYMPKKTGIDILKEVRALDLHTQIIFISGFQDFQYARDALKYGAADYLLKPVIRDELVTAIENCMAAGRTDWEEKHPAGTGTADTAVPYDKLVEVEETTYLPVLLDILWEGKESLQEKKLIRFSIISYVEHYLEEHGLGIIFTKGSHNVMVLKGIGRSEAKELLYELIWHAEAENRHKIGAIIGEPVETMGDIPEGYGKCLGMLKYFFFHNQIAVPILMTGVPVFDRPVTMEGFTDCRTRMIEAIISQDADGWKGHYHKFLRRLCILSDGKKEDACFHFCSTIRVIEERFQAMGLKGTGFDMKDILEEGRLTEHYEQMSELYGAYLEQYWNQIRDSVVNNDKKDIIRAKEYIEEHYKENLTLEVLAQEIHMNSYYFSSFFKKHSGENFKDYVNKIRMEHALSLLVSTDKKTYEIADEVGFRDARSFSELFQRMYGETPVHYRKRVKR